MWVIKVLKVILNMPRDHKCDLDMWSYVCPANSLLVPDYPTPTICQSQAMVGYLHHDQIIVIWEAKVGGKSGWEEEDNEDHTVQVWKYEIMVWRAWVWNFCVPCHTEWNCDVCKQQWWVMVEYVSHISPLVMQHRPTARPGLFTSSSFPYWPSHK